MKAHTEEFLWFLLWTASSLARPSWRNVHESFEGWAYRNGLGRRLRQLERQKLIEKRAAAMRPNAVEFRLTPLGALTALGGVDVEDAWASPWDGRWRIVVFDLPPAATRLALRRRLRKLRCGCLQGSVWLSPHPLPPFVASDVRANADTITIFEGQPAGRSNAEIVGSAWDFDRINKAYETYLRVLDRRPETVAQGPNPQIGAWLRQEQAAWKAATGIDPLLPKTLLPPSYQGIKAWNRRRTILGALGNSIADANHHAD